MYLEEEQGRGRCASFDGIYVVLKVGLASQPVELRT